MMRFAPYVLATALVALMLALPAWAWKKGLPGVAPPACTNKLDFSVACNSQYLGE